MSGWLLCGFPLPPASYSFCPLHHSGCGASVEQYKNWSLFQRFLRSKGRSLWNGHSLSRFKNSNHFLCLRSRNLVMFLNNWYSWELCSSGIFIMQRGKGVIFLCPENPGWSGLLQGGEDTRGFLKWQWTNRSRWKRESGGRVVIGLWKTRLQKALLFSFPTYQFHTLGLHFLYWLMYCHYRQNKKK